MFNYVHASQGQQLVHSQRNGVIMSNHHLALQAVSRHQAGNYSCVASNVEGDSRSNTVMLKVQCKSLQEHNITSNAVGSVSVIHKIIN